MNETKENLRKAYNNYIKDEANQGNEMNPWHADLRNLFLEMITAEGKQTLLDIGAGSGCDTQFFIDHGFDVTAIDLSDEMVKVCKEQGIRAMEYDLYELSQFGQTFDAMWAMNSLIHVEKCNLPHVLQEIREALNPSGLFFMGVYGSDDWEGILEGDLFSPPRYFSFYSEEKIREVVSQYFELIRFETIDFGKSYYFQAMILRKGAHDSWK